MADSPATAICPEDACRASPEARVRGDAKEDDATTLDAQDSNAATFARSAAVTYMGARQSELGRAHAC